MFLSFDATGTAVLQSCAEYFGDRSGDRSVELRPPACEIVCVQNMYNLVHRDDNSLMHSGSGCAEHYLANRNAGQRCLEFHTTSDADGERRYETA